MVAKSPNQNDEENTEIQCQFLDSEMRFFYSPSNRGTISAMAAPIENVSDLGADQLTSFSINWQIWSRSLDQFETGERLAIHSYVDESGRYLLELRSLENASSSVQIRCPISPTDNDDLYLPQCYGNCDVLRMRVRTARVISF